MSAFEKLLAIFQSISQLVDGMMRMVKSIEAISQAMKLLGLATTAYESQKAGQVPTNDMSIWNKI